MRTRIVGVALAALLAAGLAPVALADTNSSCSGQVGDGDWPFYGHDLHGTRNQPTDPDVSPATAGNLHLAWASTVPAGQSTPVIAGGCIYVAGGNELTAVSLSDGSTVWQQPIVGNAFAVAVANGRVYVNLDVGGAQAVSFDAATGENEWQSPVVHDFGGPTPQVISSAIVTDGKQLVPTTGPDSDPFARPGILVFDATSTGMGLLAKHTTIPSADLDKGYAGGGIWATPVVDERTKYAYVGTAQPDSKQREHAYDNAIVKIDLDETRPTFGQVVASYKGDSDNYNSGLYGTPSCDIAGDTLEYHPAGFSAACGQLDLDFGASPTMWTNSAGHLLVGELQKSGTFHVADASSPTLQPAWKHVLSDPINPATGGNGSSAANDGERVYVEATPDVLYALDKDTGAIDWIRPLNPGIGYGPVSVVNGVVFAVSVQMLWAIDAATGNVLAVRQTAVDSVSGPGVACNAAAGGVAAVHGTVVLNCDGTLLAYRV